MKYKLSDICSGITDGSHNPPAGISKSNYLMLSSKNVFDDEITFDDPRYLSEEQYVAEHKRTGIMAGDVLMTIVGTVGRTAVVSDGMQHGGGCPSGVSFQYRRLQMAAGRGPGLRSAGQGRSYTESPMAGFFF